MRDKVFIDSNLWLYLYSYDIPKSTIIEKLVEDNFSNIRISIQIINEVYNVLVKKFGHNKIEAKGIVFNIVKSFEIFGIDFQVTQLAININIRYKYSFWDSLIIASALISECSILYTEDMQHGQLIDGSLRIVNPFLGE